MISPEFVYLLKVNLALVAFYTFYRLICTNDTFFQWRRFTLLACGLTAWLYPFLNLQDWMAPQTPVHEAVTYAKAVYSETFSTLPVNAAAANPPAGDTFSVSPQQVLLTVYLAGVIILGIRFLIQLFCLCRLPQKCRKIKIKTTQVHLLTKHSGPFSFFHWIFIHPDTLKDTEQTKEILSHEQTHARQWHSVDILLSEINCIFNWMNPISWLLKREVRHNLEYLADRQVVAIGHNLQIYQYHLLEMGLVRHKAAATLYNSFNVSPLKKRILMMNKRRTKEIGRAKYMMFLPLAATLMLFGPLETGARSAEKGAHSTAQSLPLSSRQQKAEPNTETSDEKAADTTAQSLLLSSRQQKAEPNTETSAEKATHSTAQSLSLSSEPQKADRSPKIKQVGSMIHAKTPLILLNGKVVSKKINFDVQTADNDKFAEFLGIKPEEIGKIEIYKADEAVEKYGERAKDGVVAFQTQDYLKAQGTYDDGYILQVIDYQTEGSAISYSMSTTQKFQENEPDKIYKFVNEPPTFNGETRQGLLNYLNQKLKNTEIVENTGSHPQFVLVLTIEKNGAVSAVDWVNNGGTCSPEKKEEILKTIKNMPAWNPAKLEGNTVRCYSYQGFNLKP